MQYLPYAALGAGMAYKTARRLGYMDNRRQYRKKIKLPIRNAAKIRRLQGSVEKNTNDTINSTSPTTTGVFTRISAIAQGDTSLTRTGLKIQPLSLFYKLFLTMHASATNTTVRVIIFTDREQQGTDPTAAQLLEADSTSAFTEHDTRPRFKIHRDMVIVMGANGPNTNVFLKGFIKFGAKSKIFYSGTSAAESSLGKNNLYAYILGSEATNVPLMNLSFRLRFVG